MSSSTGNEIRRRGRPRRDGRALVGDPTDDVLRAATTLFGQRGVNATTMSSIAAAAGLRASSIYYYFRNRDEIVAALVGRAHVVALELLERITATTPSAAAKPRQF